MPEQLPCDNAHSVSSAARAAYLAYASPCAQAFMPGCLASLHAIDARRVASRQHHLLLGMHVKSAVSSETKSWSGLSHFIVSMGARNKVYRRSEGLEWVLCACCLRCHCY